jgi:dual specificity tyrosine-phosphorylation-regulated kinase 2/3/4
MWFVRAIAIQLLQCLSHLASLNILHCDLKPENILIRDENTASVVVIDFGSSCLIDEVAFTYVQSRFYRAPEIILGLPYGKDIVIKTQSSRQSQLTTINQYRRRHL